MKYKFEYHSLPRDPSTLPVVRINDSWWHMLIHGWISFEEASRLFPKDYSPYGGYPYDGKHKRTWPYMVKRYVGENWVLNQILLLEKFPAVLFDPCHPFRSVETHDYNGRQYQSIVIKPTTGGQ